MIRPDCDNFVDLIQARAQDESNKVAFEFLQGNKTESSLTNFQLDASARSIGATLASGGPSRKQALLLYPPGLDFIEALLGCLYAGTIAVPVYPPTSESSLRNVTSIALDAQCSTILSTESFMSYLQKRFAAQFDLPGIEFVCTDLIEPNAAQSWSPERIQGDKVAYLQYTSGSTSQPKGVVITHDNLWKHERLWYEARSRQYESRLQDAYRMFNWLPLFHDMGLVGNVFRPVFLGVACYHMSPLQFVRDPVSWLEGITQIRATVTGGPNFAYDLCVNKVSTDRLQSLDLSSWESAYIGADRIRLDTLERFAAKFRQAGFHPAKFYPVYGLAEATLEVTSCTREKHYSVVYLRRAPVPGKSVDVVNGDMGNHKHRVVGCGSMCAGIEVKVVDPETSTLCDEDITGEIWVKGPAVGRGYWGKPELSQYTFSARLEDDDEPSGYLRTGDLGFIHADELFVTGRLKDIIIIRGSNYYPEDIEEIVGNCHPAIRPGSAVAFGLDSNTEEILVVVAEIRSATQDHDLSGIKASINRAVSEAYGVTPSEVLLLPKGSVPKTSSGKVRRKESQLIFLGNRFGFSDPSTEESSVTYCTDEQTVERLVSEIWCSVLDVNTVKLEDHFFELNGDSLRAAQVISRVSDIFGLEVPIEDLFEHPTLYEFSRSIKSRLVIQTSLTEIASIKAGRERGTL